MRKITGFLKPLVVDFDLLDSYVHVLGGTVCDSVFEVGEEPFLVGFEESDDVVEGGVFEVGCGLAPIVE